MSHRTQQPVFNYFADPQQTSACFAVSKQYLHDILPSILSTCNLRVYGYNTHYDAFWGKKIQENNRHYSFELSLTAISETNTNLVIETLAGNHCEAVEIIASIKEEINNISKSRSQLSITRTGKKFQ